MVKNLIIACCDDEVKRILVKNCSSYFGENQLFICNNYVDMYQHVKYAENAAIIFDKYFLGWILSYQILRVQVLNSSILSYFVEIGDCSRYFGIRVYGLGINGYIPEIESRDVFKKNISRIQAGLNSYPETILRSIEDEDFILDKKCITEITAKEMEIGMYLGMGKTQKEICYITGLSKSVVSTHIHRLKRKIGYKKPGDFILLDQSYTKHFTGGRM